MRNKYLGTGEAGYHPVRKFKVVVSGLKYAIFSDFAVAYKVVLAAGVVVLAVYYRQLVDVFVVATATVMMLVAELFNSVFEALCDYIQAEKDARIKAIKDMAAAAAAVTIVFWWAVLLYEFSSVFW